jgi:hypothetical protein
MEMLQRQPADSTCKRRRGLRQHVTAGSHRRVTPKNHASLLPMRTPCPSIKYLDERPIKYRDDSQPAGGSSGATCASPIVTLTIDDISISTGCDREAPVKGSSRGATYLFLNKISIQNRNTP